MMNLVSRCSGKASWCSCLYCIRKPGENPDMKVNHLWARELSSITEQAICFRRFLIKLPWVECWQELVFSRVELWWINGSKNSETCLWTATEFVHRAHGQISCWWRWYELWHRRRIRHVVNIQIILAQDEWSNAKDSGRILKKCNTRQQQTFFHLVNVYVFDIGSVCTHGKELIGNFTFHKNTKQISQWNRCSTYLKSWWPNNQIRSMVWKHLFYWCDSSWNHVSLIGDEEVVSLSREGLCIFQCLYCVLEKRESIIKHCMVRKIGVVQKFITIQNFGHNWWWANGNRVEYFPQIHHIAALLQSPRVPVKELRTRRFPRTDHLHVDVQRHLMGI